MSVIRKISKTDFMDFINSKAFESITIGDEKEKIIKYLKNKKYKCIYDKDFILIKFLNVEFTIDKDNKIVLIHFELSEFIPEMGYLFEPLFFEEIKEEIEKNKIEIKQSVFDDHLIIDNKCKLFFENKKLIDIYII
ncbi:hypothetical protein [Myroides sp. DF42-4-2]|uniref:hypothetical protein n=1 Tax=Myroides sp. DF42-4-2 TaxID=2746726 RepID=UPI0025789126|nr:hypothetical protein [Myroides sp. DF42-4-2]MDM1409042.1 hypothetical protein [Myroides sp. DF42-4-2]